MSAVDLVAIVLSALCGAGGIVAWLRAGAQNRRDNATSRREGAEADAVLVGTARELVRDLRAEMDRKVSDLQHEVGRLSGHLESAVAERDHLREVERQLREENSQLRARMEALEARVRELTGALAAAHAASVATTQAATSTAAEVVARVTADHS